MKKIIYLALVIILALASLTGCMRNDNNGESNPLSSTMSKVESVIDDTVSKTESNITSN